MFMIPGMMVLSYAAVGDIRTKRIPRSAIAASLLCAAATCIAAFAEGTEGFTMFLLSGLPGALLLILSFLSREAVGYGDGLLMLCMGPVFGLHRTVLCVAIAFFVTALISAGLLALRKAGRSTRIPFVPFLASAMGVVALAYR